MKRFTMMLAALLLVCMAVGVLAETAAELPKPATENNGTEYRVYCADEKGNPVAGATIQFCSDVSCMMKKTDETGLAIFAEQPGHYTVHLLKPPKGYEKDSTEYPAPETCGDVVIVLKTAAQ